MRISIERTLKLSKLDELRRRANPRSREMLAWKKRAAIRYRREQQVRFAMYSRGGGNWKPTKSRKKHNRKGRKFILRSSDTLFKALTPEFKNLPGQYEQFTGDTVVVSIRGGDHPDTPLTVGELARIHHFGLGIQDARKIIVQPSQQFRQSTLKDLKDTFLK